MQTCIQANSEVQAMKIARMADRRRRSLLEPTTAGSQHCHSKNDVTIAN